MKIVVSRCAAAVVMAILVCGCSEGKQQGRLFTSADATRIVGVAPAAPGWTWPRKSVKPVKPVSPDSSRKSGKTDPLLARFKRQTASLGVGEASNRWRDKDKLGNLDVGVYASADDARKGLAAFNAFSRGWGSRSGHITRDEEIDGLGDEAWVLWVGGYGTQVTYHWRRSNLVIEAHVHCFGLCPADVDAAARAWVDAIDAEAGAQR